MYLTAKSGLRIWADTKKKPLSQSVNPPGGTDSYYGDEIYWWTVGTDTFGEGARTFYVEGTLVGSHDVIWEVTESDGVTVIASDTVEINAEPIVWPDSYTWENWQKQQTPQWTGYYLEPGWSITKSLCDIINTPTDRGEVRTMYPDVAATGQDPPEALSGEGPDILSNQTYSGFTLVFDFRFDNDDTHKGYVNADTDCDGEYEPPPGDDAHKLSFFANSGIKIWGIYEIALFDTNSMLEVPSVSVDQNGVVSAPGYTNPEKITQLMTGVAYGAPIDDAVKDYENASGTGAAKMQDALENNAAHFNEDDWNTLTVTFKPNGTSGGHQKYEVKVYVGSGAGKVLLYENGNVLKGTGGSSGTYLDSVDAENRKLRLQNHWDSGVFFRDIRIDGPLA